MRLPALGSLARAAQDDIDFEDMCDAIEEFDIEQVERQNKIEQSLLTKSEYGTEKDKTLFRDYDNAPQHVKDFYKEQHTKQTMEYNLKARADFKSKTRAIMTVWEAMKMLDKLVDESDPDTSVGQIEHLLQSAEAMRRDGQPRWMQCTGLVHDLGKLLNFFESSGQWAVVGDTFPVGCAFDDDIIFTSKSFSDNPDTYDPIYSTRYGIYQPGCGLDNVMLSWGHDEYLYQVVKTQSRLPREALAMIRFHSFYPWHNRNAYDWMMDKDDIACKEAVKVFSPYDLYSKSDKRPDVGALKPYYQELIDEFFGFEEDGSSKKLRW